MKQYCRSLALLLAAAAVPAHADDFESLHILNINLKLTRGVTAQLHTRGRTFEDASQFNQFRFGPILMWQVRPKTTALFGYYRIEQNTRKVHEHYKIDRFWAGAQHRLISAENWSLDGRSIVERHHSDHFNDYFRFRNRLMLNRRTPIGMAYLSGEALVQERIPYGRYTAGMQWKAHKRVTLGAGYEYRDAARGAGSHIIATFMQWDAWEHIPPHVD